MFLKYCLGLILLLISSELKSEPDFLWQTPENISILNSKYEDYAPSFNKYDNKLYFTSERSGNNLFYQSDYKSGFSKPLIVKGLLNSKTQNRSFICFADSCTVYLAASRPTNLYPVMNIATSKFERTYWTEPYFVESLQTANFCSQPTSSIDGNTIVFSSCKNGDHQTDLFMTLKDINGKWSEPIPLDELNSAGNEVSPFLFSDSIMFFASDGLSGIGGFDIYKAEFYDGIWQRPTPINSINTEFDEADFVVLPDLSAVFASNRPNSLGGFDLYYAMISNEIINQSNDVKFISSFKSSLPEIRIRNKKEKLNLPNNLLFPIDYNIYEIDEYLSISGKEINFDYSVKDFSNYILHLSAAYSKHSKKKIIISFDSKTSIESINELKGKIERVFDYLNLPAELYEFERVEDVPIACFSISTPAASDAVLIKSNISFVYNTIELTVDISPASELSDINLSINLDTKEITILDTSGVSTPFTKSFELNNYANLLNQDVLAFTARSTDESKILPSKLEIPIFSTSSSKSFGFASSNLYIFSEFSSSYESFLESNKATIEEFLQIAKIAKSIKLSSGKVSGSTKLIYLEKLLNENNIKYQLEMSSDIKLSKLPDLYFIIVSY